MSTKIIFIFNSGIMSSEKQGLSNFGKGSNHSPTKIQKAGTRLLKQVEGSGNKNRRIFRKTDLLADFHHQ